MFAFNKSERKEFDYIDYVITVNVVAFLCCFVSAPIAWALFFVLCSVPLRLSLAGIDGNSKTTGYFKQILQARNGALLPHLIRKNPPRARRITMERKKRPHQADKVQHGSSYWQTKSH